VPHFNATRGLITPIEQSLFVTYETLVAGGEGSSVHPMSILCMINSKPKRKYKHTHTHTQDDNLTIKLH